MRALLALLLVAALAAPAAATTPPSLTPVDGQPGTLELRLDSAALGRRTTALVLLPASYREAGPPSAVAYYLHDQSVGTSARAAFDGLGLAGSAGSRDFVIVAPDMGAETWCATCLWVDGISGVGVAAETHLVDELLPAVEDLLNARRDRGGRAVFGSGMGATGALIQALSHPDRFRFAGGDGPTLDLAGPDLPATDEAFLASQGVPPLAAAEALHRNLSPADLAEAAVNAGLEVLVTAGDAPRAAIAERVSAVWTQLGFAHTLVRQPGAEVFAETFVPRLNTTFSRPDDPPWRFSYKTTDRAFSVWGYDVAVDRPNTEFLHVLGARRDGRELILSGTGTVALTTPPAFKPGRTYEVVATPDPRTEDPLDPGAAVNPYHPTTTAVTADAGGRLTLEVALAPARVHDEREALLRAGGFPLEHVRVAVLDPKAAAASAPAAAGSRPLHTDLAALPAPFDQWHVQLEVAANAGNPAGSPQVLRLEYDSPALAAFDAEKEHYDGARGSVMVYLPDRYVQRTGPLPVLYWLHGTFHGNQHFNLRLHELLDTLPFVVVVPDSGSAMNWCKDCQWVDQRTVTDHPLDAQLPGVGEGGGPGDTYLHAELIPLVEALFDVGTDRAARAVAGNSMGALGALNQAFRHPDRFSFAGGLSGWLDHGSYDTAHTPQWVSYFESHHYPLREQAPALYRDVSPLHTAPGATTANIDVIASVGDGCVSGGGWCSAEPDALPAPTWTQERLARGNHDVVAPRLDTLGLAWTHPRWRGVHYLPDGDVFRAYYVPRLVEHFADPPPEPAVFSFKTTRQQFSVWGYDVAVQRPNYDFEFLNLLGMRRDGRDFTLAGTGVATVTTPAAFAPGAAYDATITRDGVVADVQPVVADPAGRLQLRLELAPGRTEPEHEPAVAAGRFGFPHTRVEIAPA